MDNKQLIIIEIFILIAGCIVAVGCYFALTPPNTSNYTAVINTSNNATNVTNYTNLTSNNSSNQVKSDDSASTNNVKTNNKKSSSNSYHTGPTGDGSIITSKNGPTSDGGYQQGGVYYSPSGEAEGPADSI